MTCDRVGAVGLLKADPTTLTIPVPIFTSHFLEGALAKATRGEADEFIRSLPARRDRQPHSAGAARALLRSR